MQYFIQGLLQRRWSVIVASLLLTGAACLKRQASQMPTTTLVSYPAAPRINGETFFSTAYDQFNPELRAAHHPNYTVLGIDLTQYGYAGLNLSSRQLTNAEMTHDVNDSSHAFIALEEGLNYPHWQPPASAFIFVTSANGNDYRPSVLANCSRIGSDVEASRGNWGTAMQYDIDTIALGDNIEHGATIQSALVGVGSDEIGRHGANSLVNHLTAQQAEESARRLAKLDRSRVQPYQTIDIEKCIVQSLLLQSFNNSEWQLSIDIDVAGGNPNITNYFSFASTPSSMLTILNDMLESPKTAFDSYTDRMNKMTLEAKLPWPQYIARQTLRQPSDPVTRVLAPQVVDIVFDYDTMAAYDRLLEVQLALRAYQLDHETYPATLTELVPRYLPSVPIDPFTPGLPLKYKTVSGLAYTLYSVGPDAKDDGGNPVYEYFTSKRRLIIPTDSTENLYPGHRSLFQLLDENQKGDIVAGINQ